MILNIDKVPGLNALYKDYIENFDSVKSFYQYGYQTSEDFLKCVEDKKQSYPSGKVNRAELSNILIRQNKFFNSAEKTYENLESLKDENTFAIVTGQQVGILSGPLYTIYKALNTIQLAEKLNSEFKEYKFVPVFWLEADDHDFLEINNINILNKENELVNLRYFEGGVEQERYLKPATSVLVDDNFENLIKELEENLHHTDFSDAIFDYIRRSYRVGIDLKTAFARFLNYLFENSGLIFFDPTDPEIKRFLIPVIEKELNTFPKVCEIVIDASAQLEHNYEPQIKPKAINLFYNHNENRYLIEPRDDNSFGLKNSRQKFEKSEMIDSLNLNYQNFSSNVITRPIFQDFILPTIAYIGGPSEISYFAQLKNVYEYFNVRMPIIYPRTSVTLMESKSMQFFKKYDIMLEEMFNQEAVNEKLLGKTSEINLEELFNEYIDEMNSLNYSFEKELVKVDKNLVNNFKNRNQKNFETLQMLKQKFIDSQINQNEGVFAKMKSIYNNIYPESKLQERILNVSYFLNKYGIDLMKMLKTNINISEFNHQLIELNVKEQKDLF
ncbi:MAG TPA: bacillithiol biosynthesis cysteine-adding enzyme BshC [Ignavibacteria bacterium]|nr:bacillithiol biosynthesis cysteine-adding enzyme BshC [Ignavibacteria bacterium]